MDEFGFGGAFIAYTKYKKNVQIKIKQKDQFENVASAIIKKNIGRTQRALNPEEGAQFRIEVKLP